MIPFLKPLIAVWIGWKVSQKAALLSIIITLGGWLSGLHDAVSDAVHVRLSQLQPDLHALLCLAGFMEAVDILLLAGQWAFWWWAVMMFFRLRA